MSLEEKIDYVLAIGLRVYNKNKLSEGEKKLIISTYKEATGVRKKDGCGSCFVEIYEYFNKHKNQKKMNNEFLLKETTKTENHKLYFGGDVLMRKGAVNNCTREKALALLKSNLSNIKHFDRYPANYAELAANFDPLKAMRSQKEEPVIQTQGILIHPNIDVEKIKREAFENKSVKDLKQFLLDCFESDPVGYPKKEWQTLNKESLVSYILSKS
jgi:hypothetical protein